MHIRLAQKSDLPHIRAIYNDAILTSTATYDYEIQSLAERQQWFAEKQAHDMPVHVCTIDENVTGFATYGPFRGKDGYRFTVEHSVYVDEAQRGHGVGTALLSSLIMAATFQGLHVMIAGIDADNAASVRLHRRFGFEQVAYFKEVGYKFERWLDVIFMQKILDAGRN